MDYSNWSEVKTPGKISYFVDCIFDRYLFVTNYESLSLIRFNLEGFLNEKMENGEIFDYLIYVDNQKLSYLKNLIFTIYIIIDQKNKTYCKLKRKF